MVDYQVNDESPSFLIRLNTRTVMLSALGPLLIDSRPMMRDAAYRRWRSERYARMHYISVSKRKEHMRHAHLLEGSIICIRYIPSLHPVRIPHRTIRRLLMRHGYFHRNRTSFPLLWVGIRVGPMSQEEANAPLHMSRNIPVVQRTNLHPLTTAHTGPPAIHILLVRAQWGKDVDTGAAMVRVSGTSTSS